MFWTKKKNKDNTDISVSDSSNTDNGMGPLLAKMDFIGERKEQAANEQACYEAAVRFYTYPKTRCYVENIRHVFGWVDDKYKERYSGNDMTSIKQYLADEKSRGSESMWMIISAGAETGPETIMVFPRLKFIESLKQQGFGPDGKYSPQNVSSAVEVLYCIEDLVKLFGEENTKKVLKETLIKFSTAVLLTEEEEALMYQIFHAAENHEVFTAEEVAGNKKSIDAFIGLLARGYINLFFPEYRLTSACDRQAVIVPSSLGFSFAASVCSWFYDLDTANLLIYPMYPGEEMKTVSYKGLELNEIREHLDSPVYQKYISKIMFHAHSDRQETVYSVAYSPSSPDSAMSRRAVTHFYDALSVMNFSEISYPENGEDFTWKAGEITEEQLDAAGMLTESMIQAENPKEPYLLAQSLKAFSVIGEDEDWDEDENEEKTASDKLKGDASYAEEFLKKYPPAEIVKYLDKSIAGQTEAKRQCAAFLYRQVMRYVNSEKDYEKPGLLVAGPTGCGKTKIWRELEKISPVPVSIYDISTLTQAGYRGADINEIFDDIQKYDKKAREYAIIVLDEFDKLCAGKDSRESEWYRGTQGQLLGMIEGRIVGSDSKNPMMNDVWRHDTKNNAFVFLGAFEDVMKAKQEKENAKQSRIGFSTVEKQMPETLEYHISEEDVVSCGLRSELAGRIGNYAAVNPLSEDDMVNIMIRIPENIVGNTMKYAEGIGIKLDISEDAVKFISHRAFEKKLGARSLKGMLMKVVDEETFDFIGKADKKAVPTVSIAKDTVEKYFVEK